MSRASPWSRHVDEIIAVLVVGIIVATSMWRLRFGVDFTDEAFYAALTQRFSLGDLPYLDEYNLRQSAGLITVPFYWLFLKIQGNTDGCVYFLRTVYFGFQCLTGWTIYRFALPRIPRSYALVAASFPLVFIPFGTPSCSYNTLGALFFCSGTFLGLSALLDDKRSGSILAAGIAHGLACVAYPPMAIAVTLFGLTSYVRPELLDRTQKEPRRQLGAYALGVISVGFLLLLWLMPGLLHHGVRAALNYEHQTTSLRTAEKAKAVIQACSTLMPLGKGSWLATLGFMGIAGKLYPATRKWIGAAFVLYIAWFFSETQPEYTPNLNSLYLMVFLGIYGIAFILTLDGARERNAMALSGWLPSMVAGFITAFATDNRGCLNGGLGCFAAASLALVSLAMSCDPRSLPWNIKAAGVALLALIPLSTLDVNTETTYRMGSPAVNTVKVRTGPYKGMYGQPAVVRQAEEMTTAVRQFVKPGDRMLSYPDFPAAYIAATGRPAIPTVWSDRRAKLGLLLPYYQAHRTGNGIALSITSERGACPDFERVVEDPARIVGDIGWARLYREPPP